MPRDLRAFAEHSTCYLRLPEFCKHEAGNVVLAHIRRGGIAGKGEKPCDLNGVPACYFCHVVYDGQKQPYYTREHLDAEMLRAHCQWLEFLWKHGLVTVVL